LINTPSTDKTPYQSCYFFYVFFSRSCRQGYPIAPLVYILQAEPVACAIRGDSEIQGIKLPGGKDGEYIETKLFMFADDTQLFNKNDESVKKSFDILTIYEKEIKHTKICHTPKINRQN
jgi:hypothetical protein